MGSGGKVRKTKTPREQGAIHVSFALITALTAAAIIVAAVEGRSPVSAFLIDSVMIAAFWWFSAKSHPSTRAVILGQAVILLSAGGTAFNLWQMSMAGVTFDTYVHLLAAFSTTLLLISYLETRMEQKKAILSAATVVVVLGLGVEAVEFLDGLAHGSLQGDLPSTCARAFCSYWQDTIKDLLNDVLGALFPVVAINCQINRETKQEKERRKKH